MLTFFPPGTGDFEADAMLKTDMIAKSVVPDHGADPIGSTTIAIARSLGISLSCAARDPIAKPVLEALLLALKVATGGSGSTPPRPPAAAMMPADEPRRASGRRGHMRGG